MIDAVLNLAILAFYASLPFVWALITTKNILIDILWFNLTPLQFNCTFQLLVRYRIVEFDV